MILTRGAEMLLTPTYHVFRMYNVHQGATFLPVEFECGQIPTVSGWAAAEPQAHNDFGREPAVSPAPFKGYSIKNGRVIVNLPPASIVVMQL